MTWRTFSTALLTLLFTLVPTSAQTTGINLEGYEYPFPVEFLPFDNGVRMAYMVVAPTATSNDETVVLLHGKNFNGAYWEETARLLSSRGYRVVIPDQVGFGKSSKPLDYSYTFPQLVTNTEALLDHLNIDEVTVVAHSMGGMLGMHWALLSPERLERLILVNPIGLEDWLAKGVPYRGLEGWYEKELATSRESIESYQRRAYYDGDWNQRYARWANLLAAPLGSPDYPRFARVQALTTAMVMSEPVAHRFEQINLPVWLILGERDRTALDRDLAPPEVAAELGRYDRLGQEVVARLPQGHLIALPGLGHLPQVEDFSRFQDALLEALSSE